MRTMKLYLRILTLFTAAILFALPVNSQQSSVQVFYVATAVDAQGTESKTSNEATATLTPLHNVASLSWTASTSTVSGYNIYRGRVSGGPYTKLNSVLVSGTTYSDTFPFPASPSALTVSVP